MFIEKQAELFAYIIYLNNKHNRNYNIEVLLNSSLNSGWYLDDKEQKALLRNAMTIAERQYGLKKSLIMN